jgi:uncharacterized membrane protein YkvI
MANTKQGKVNVFTVAATYMGTIVGAGFASGQEVLQFFAAYGINGLWAAAFSTVMFILFGYVILLFGFKLNASSYLDVIRFATGRKLGFIVDIIITVFLFGALSAMIAGAGAVFEEQFGWSPLLGNILMAVVTLITVWTGIRGVINAISYVVPVLLASIIFVAVYTITRDPVQASDWSQAQTTIDGASPNWFISSINYVSYNLVIAVAVLAPLGASAKTKKTLLWGAIAGGLSLGIGVFLILFSILANIEQTATVEIPMIQVVASISAIFQIVFSVILFAEIFTTAVGNLFGFITRITLLLRLKDKLLMVIVTVAAFIVSQFGFSSMVQYLYPAVGYGGMILLAGLVYSWVFRRKSME